MVRFPPYLQKGDQIGLVCPAGFMNEEKYLACILQLEHWGFRVKVGSTPGQQFHYFSGTDSVRLSDLQTMMDDDGIQAILCARGGYGTGRIIDLLDFTKFIQAPKWIIGFSDITVIHSHLLSRYNIASIHGPMAAAFQEGVSNNPYLKSWLDVVTGNATEYLCAPHDYNQLGEATGQLVGGNLSLLAHLVGTASDINTVGKILFIEDVGEYIYNIDRMMYQLKRSGKLSGLKGLIVGHFSDMKDTTVPFGQDVNTLIKEMIKEYNFPVCFHFPVSHDRENYALKVGGTYTLTINQDQVALKEVPKN